MGRMAGTLLVVVIVLVVLYNVLEALTGGGTGDAPADKERNKQPEVDAEQGRHKLWPRYKEPVEELSKKHPEPEPKMVIRLTGDDKHVELSGFHSCAKFFDRTVLPPFEARVPYCDDRWEMGWVEAGSRTEGEWKLEVLLGGQVRQTATLINKRTHADMKYSETLSLNTSEAWATDGSGER